MSSGLSGIKENLIHDDPKQVELVEKIAEKTRMGKIVWERGPSSLVATAPGMQLSFVRSSPGIESALLSLGLGGGSWEMFSIRSQQGAEIMKVEQPSSLAYFGVPGSAPPSRGKLLEAVDALYSTANSRGHGDIDKALNVIKNL
ncbi:MAG: hypothetical protein WCC89_05220 [Candidatus Sulfotelmatobacter sp.]|jgi:hypothetical protein